MNTTCAREKLNQQKIIGIASASGWRAVFQNQTKPVAFWAVNDSHQLCGVIVYEQEFENAASMSGFQRFEPSSGG